MTGLAIRPQAGGEACATCQCRSCGAPLGEAFLDLGMSPLANSFVAQADAGRPEARYPLRLALCGACQLVQLADDLDAATHFHDGYAYFSSYSESWLAHCRAYVAEMCRRFALGPGSEVVEVASNDGYLLQYFKQRSIDVLGVEPAANTARVASETRGVPTLVAFFGRKTAARLRAAGRRPGLMVANNVLAHTPDLNDFVAGFELLLAPDGVATFEFPHLLRLLAGTEFDTVYHEHYSYLSLEAVERLLAAHALRVFDVAELPTHGGSLRLFVCHRDGPFEEAPGVRRVRAAEESAGLGAPRTYAAFAARVGAVREAVVGFLAEARRSGSKVAGYGAPAKGNTLLNFCGVGPDLLPFTVDRSPAKQGRLLPGTRIPVLHPDCLMVARPDYVLILPWNLKEEIIGQQAAIRAWGGRFVTPIPRLEVIP